MKKRNIAIIIVVIILVIGGLVFVKLHGADLQVSELMKINTTLEMNEAQQALFSELEGNLKNDPSDYSSLFKLARLKQDMLDFDGAAELYNKLLETKPGDTLVMNNLGSIYYDSKQYDKAEELQLQIIAKTPKWIGAYKELMMIYRYQLKDKAPTLEDKLLYGYNNFAEYKLDFTSMLSVYYDEIMNDPMKAKPYYEELAELLPEDAQVQARLIEIKNIK